MAFFQKLLNYLVNEVVVQGLANSRTFQRFAIRTDAMINEMKQKGGQHGGELSEQAVSFFKTFREEVSKGLSVTMKQQGGQQPPFKR